jgi:predicted ribonuclease YlaK|tara:strand:- start:96 stop:800 length:705 start_codon:yes stop_codon:yes gene_type:complete
MKTQLISHDQLVEMKGVTKNQLEVFKQYAEGKNLFLYGPAGTGKTFVILYNAIKEVLDPKTNYNCIYIVRSLMPTRSLAFMPGDEQDKSSLYQVPYDNMLQLMFKLSSKEQFDMMYEELKKQENVAFLSTSFLRGITLDNAIVLVDECQNLNFHELDTIMTRVGQESKIMFSGDFDQTDLREDDEKAGLGQFIKIINEMKEFYSCEFDIGDIVRSGLVRSYIIQKYNTGLGDRK